MLTVFLHSNKLTTAAKEASCLSHIIILAGPCKESCL